jgi:hypothetical protein
VYGFSVAGKDAVEPPARPKDMTAEQLGFTPQPYVRWFHPFELARAGIRALLADMFGAYADKRELQAALHAQSGRIEYSYVSLDPTDPSSPARQELWLDFVADIGDGFHATYAVASLLAREQLTLEHEGKRYETQRGSLLVMGGDEVYPGASRTEYAERTVGPYRAALPFVADERAAPHLFVLPGNHDWYDGLSAFLRQFTQRRWVGGWKTQQERSYFVLELPHRLWVWGIDIQLHADVDGPQLSYFDTAAASLGPGHSVILCTAEPSWVEVASGQSEGYRNLAFIEAKVLARGARLVLVLTGDSHHYARFREESGRTYLTAGGGGAFLHGTHTLPERIELRGSDVAPGAGRENARNLVLEKVFPERAESRQQLPRIFRFSQRNKAFALLWAAIWLVVGWSLLSASLPASSHFAAESTFAGELALAGPSRADITSRPGAWLGFALLVVLDLCIGYFVHMRVPAIVNVARGSAGTSSRHEGLRLAFDLLLWVVPALAPAILFGMAPLAALLRALARSPTALSVCLLVACGAMVYVSHARLSVRITVGLAHAGVQLLSWLFVATCLASALVPLGRFSTGEGVLPQLERLVIFGSWVLSSALLAGLASATIFGIYLWFAGRYLPQQLNDVFSALAVEDYKNFLRLHLDAQGQLTLYPIGIRRVPREWQLNPDASPGASFLIPREELKAELIEAPLVL